MTATINADIHLSAFTVAAVAVAKVSATSKKASRKDASATDQDLGPHNPTKAKDPVTRKPEYLAMSLIRTDGGTQARVEINDATVKEYVEALREGAKFPPVVLYYEKSVDVYWLADGFHRFHAHRLISSVDILADVKDGTRRDAILHAAGANAAHGLRRTNADKRRAVQMLLDDPECVQWSDNAIAKACGVSQPFVANVRSAIFKPLEDDPNAPTVNAAPVTRTVTRNGTTYEQKVKSKLTANPKPSNLTELAPADTEPTIATPKSEQRIANPKPNADSPSKDNDELVLLRSENAELRNRIKELIKAKKNIQLKRQLAEAQTAAQRLSKLCVEQASRIDVLEKENEVLRQRQNMSDQSVGVSQPPEANIEVCVHDVLAEQEADAVVAHAACVLSLPLLDASVA